MDHPVLVMRRRAFAAAIVGTSVAFCDFFLYGMAITAAVAGGAASSRWLMAATFAGFVRRPLGAVLFSHLGDRVGRKSTLIATLLVIGVPTAAIGLVPLTAGFASGASLTALRFLQGVGLGGEWGGSVDCRRMAPDELASLIVGRVRGG
jgi:MFS family permease